MAKILCVEAQLRQKQARAREHPVRATILNQLSGGRGLPTSTIRRELPGSPAQSVVAYHVKVLLDAGLLETGGSPGAPVYFAR